MVLTSCARTMSFQSRPPTPDSPMSSSLRRATDTVDDLTLALANFSRASSPEPPNIATCCCGKEDCETSKVWSAWKSKMESRLVLSAEVGQALLERHEAYVRRHESSTSCPPAGKQDLPSGEEHVNARVAELVKENAVLEKRLTQALVNNEVTEAANRSTLQEVQEAQANVSHLKAQFARSIGWENRLAVALQEKDDFQQERDSATQRARLAEARISALKDTCAKLQAQVARLREDLEMQRIHRQELSQEILQDAHQRLSQMQEPGRTIPTQDTEVTKVLESLVADNEALKRDNAELQNLLTESREDVRTLQEEVEERRVGNSSYLRHRYTNSGHSSALSGPSSPLHPNFHVGTAPTSSILHASHRRGDTATLSDRRAVSVERSTRRAFEPLTPETNRRPLSPTDSLVPSEIKWSSFGTSHVHRGFELDEEGQHDQSLNSPETSRAQKSLLLLMRSRGVQTDGLWNGVGSLAPSPIPPSFGSSTPHDGKSESSSLADGPNGAISALLERVTMLLNRLGQADALTLTNRLKRQRLLGADVSHLSRTTVSNIIHEATTLRSHFRAFLEDEKATLTCSRRDLRGLFKIFKDMFSEMGQMRVTLNDVILDPTVAGKVSEMALHPAKAASAEAASADPAAHPSGSSWIAPISKLLGLPASGSASDQAATRALSPPGRLGGRAPNRIPSRIVPKREAALSASAMTVNVEFSGTAVGRSVTSTYSAHPAREDSISILAMQGALTQPVAPPNLSRSVMGIFAGAPRVEESTDPWIVVPKAHRAGPVPALSPSSSANANATGTVGRSMLRRASNRLPRAVDAVVDLHTGTIQGETGEENDVVGTLLERTLRRRGLSDSSIHTTFSSHGEEHGSPHQLIHDTEAAVGQDRSSVLQALSRKMQSFRFAGPGSFTNADAGPSVSRPDTPVSGAYSGDGRRTPVGSQAPSSRAASPASSRLFPTVSLSSWAAAAMDQSQEPSAYLASSPRDEAYIHRGGLREREI